MTRTNGEIVRLSPSDKVGIFLFFGAQTIVLIGVGIGMYTRLAVLEDRFQTQAQTIAEIKSELREIKVAQRDGK